MKADFNDNGMASDVFTIYLGARNPVPPKLEREITREDMRAIEQIIRRSFNAYTIVRGEGYWGGQREDCAVITVGAINTVKRHSPDARVRVLCDRLMGHFKQLAVFVTGGQYGLLITPKNTGAKGITTRAHAQAQLSTWAKTVIDSVRHSSRLPLKQESAVSKLSSFKQFNPDATKADGIEELRRIYPLIPL